MMFATACEGAAGIQDEQIAKDLYVRASCAAVQWMGQTGAIVGLRQMNDIDAPYHSLDVPFEFPVLLDAEQTDAFQAISSAGGSRPLPEELRAQLNGESLDSLALCEVRIGRSRCTDGGGDDGDGLRSCCGELVIAEECQMSQPVRDDGLLRLEDVSVARERCVPVAVGEALAVAMRLSVPVLLSVPFLLRASKAVVDRLRLEELLCHGGGEGCDAELHRLSERLGEGAASGSMSSAVGALVDELKPFAWYWAERSRANARSYDASDGPHATPPSSFSLREVRACYSQLQVLGARRNSPGSRES